MSKWNVTLMNAGTKWSGHPAVRTIEVQAFTGAEAEENAALQFASMKGWVVITRRTANLGKI